jgi:hypothetical protein
VVLEEVDADAERLGGFGLREGEPGDSGAAVEARRAHLPLQPAVEIATTIELAFQAPLGELGSHGREAVVTLALSDERLRGVALLQVLTAEAGESPRGECLVVPKPLDLSASTRQPTAPRPFGRPPAHGRVSESALPT